MTCPSCAGRSDDGLICTLCTHRYQRDLTALPSLMIELDITLTRQGQTGTGNRGKGAERPLPFDANASEVWDLVKMFLVNWVREFSLGDWPDDTIAGICAWLTEREQRIRGHTHGYRFVDELSDATHQVRRAIDLRPEMVYLGPCPQRLDGGELCRHQMYARKRDESYDCPGEPGVPCGAVYNVEERKEHLMSLARDQVGTVGQCAKVLAMFGLEVRSDTIHNWANPRQQRGQLRPPRIWRVNVNDKGENCYRIGDVEELAREAMHRRDTAHAG